MRPVLLLLAVIGATATAVMMMRKPDKPAINPATLHQGTLATDWQPHEVFQKALRRRPGAEDRIIHAERREWTTDPAAGISRWQWFLEVEPGKELRNWLRTQNPFSVQPAGPDALAKVAGPPAWFPASAGEFEISAGGSTGSLVLMWSRDGDTLFATSSGEGFAPAPVQPAAPVPPQQSFAARRLPDSPPPTPSKP